MTDSDLLREYADNRSAAAFAELVGRHTDWVHSFAMRQVRDRHLAEDVTQAVFVALAAKAASLNTGQPLSPWLFRVARNVSCAVRRSEVRRKRHEAEGVQMTQGQKGDPAAPPWEELAGSLDELIERLGARDRQAVLLRFYERHSHAEVAAAMGISVEAARKCVDRAVERLQAMFAHRGVVITPAALAAVIAINVTRPAGAEVLQTVTRIALAAEGAATAGPVVAMAKGALRQLTWMKIRFAAALLLAGGLLAAMAAIISNTQASVQAPAATPSAAVAAATTAPAPQSGQATPLQRLGQIYGLKEGEDLRRVKPPFPPQRVQFADTQYPYARGSRNLHSLGFTWNGKELASTYMQYPPPTLRNVVQYALQVPWYNVNKLDTVRWNPGDSDWIMREPLSIDQRLAALARLISADTGEPLVFQHRVERMACVALRGPTRPAPENGRGFTVVGVTLQPLAADELQRWVEDKRPKDSTHRFDFQGVAQLLQAPFFEEPPLRPEVASLFYISSDARLNRTDPDYRHQVRQVLDNITSQVGGEWTIEDRDVDVWEPPRK